MGFIVFNKIVSSHIENLYHHLFLHVEVKIEIFNISQLTTQTETLLQNRLERWKKIHCMPSSRYDKSVRVYCCNYPLWSVLGFDVNHIEIVLFTLFKGNI